MSAKTLYFKDAVPSGATLHRSLQDGGSAPAGATTGTGWVADQNAIGQSCIQNGGSEIGRTDGQWGATLQPSAAPSQTVGDCWRSENKIDGTFAATNWVFTFGIRSVTAAYVGRLKLAVRLWRTSDANGSSAVEITSGRVASAATTANLSTSVDTTVQFSWTPGAEVTLVSEYLFLQVGIEVTAAGSGNTQDVDFRVGAGYTLQTPDFAAGIVVKTIGSGADYTSLQSGEDAAPTNYTTSRTGTTQTGSTSSTIKLDSGASATTDFYAGHSVWCDARPSEKRLITAYNGTTKVATIGALNGSNATWDNTPGTEAFTIMTTIWRNKVLSASDAFSSSGNLLSVSGGTVDGNCYFELTTAAGAAFSDDAAVQSNPLRYGGSSGCSVTCTGGYANAININQEFTRISKLQVRHTAAGGLGDSFAIKSQLATGSSSCDIDRCIMETEGPTGAGFIWGSASTFRNSLLVQRKSGAASIASIQNAAKAYNCTFAVPSDKTAATAGIDVSNYGGSSGALHNCGIFKASAIKTGSATPTVTSGYTDLSTAGWTQVTFANQFVDTADATRDFRLKAGANMIDAGTTGAFSTSGRTDIAGTDRSGLTWDVGCWEFVAAAAGHPAMRRFGQVTRGLRVHGLRGGRVS